MVLVETLATLRYYLWFSGKQKPVMILLFSIATQVLITWIGTRYFIEFLVLATESCSPVAPTKGSNIKENRNQKL